VVLNGAPPVALHNRFFAWTGKNPLDMVRRMAATICLTGAAEDQGGCKVTKFVAVLNVIAWAGFWAFGFLALTADSANMTEIVIAGTLAALGGGIGLFTFLRCSRYCEATGYAKAHKRGVPTFETSETGS